MVQYLDIAVNVPQVSGVFSYHLPQELENKVRVGHLVLVPFGKRTVQGLVFRFTENPDVLQTRPVLELVDPEAVLTEGQIALAKFLAETCLASQSACVGLMLPPGLDKQADTLYSLSGRSPLNPTSAQKRLLKLLSERGPLRGGQIDRALPRVIWRSSARALIARGTLSTQQIIPEPQVKPKHVRTAQLACPPEIAEAALPKLGRPGSKALQRRQAMLKFLIRERGSVQVSWIYAESMGNLQDLRLLSDRGLVHLGEDHVWRDPLFGTDYQYDRPINLTQDQKQVWEHVRDAIQQAANGNNTPPLLLHGVTGSGKTEIYLRAVEETLELGKQAIILVPEIALTPQTIRRFAGRFPGKTGLMHSGLSDGERYDTWRRARRGDLGLVVGPRSALFTPFNKLGLIVVDECHDDSYYQWESAPHYHAREAAVAYARLQDSACLMGSATPDVVSTSRCQKGEWHYLSLPERILAHREIIQAQIARLNPRQAQAAQVKSRFRSLEGQAEITELPPVSIVDMRLELQTGNRSIFSRPLREALERALLQEEQSILFLNRRGTNTFIFCRDCGHNLRCPRCDLPLTYHQAQGSLRCHYCSYTRKPPKSCPQCHGERIRHYGTGTQRVEAEVQSLFPQARTLRWDHETTRKKGAHDAILNQFVAHRADVLIGTQMLAKGLDLPLVTLVGVVLADVGLSLPDYRANERAFQVLTQVAGRAGRSPLGGQVILQTFQPEHYVIQAASLHDYRAFCEQELTYRRQLGYPPYTQLVRLEYRDNYPVQAEETARKLALQIKGWLAEGGYRSTRMIGPAPCFFARQGGQYRWQIVLSGPDPASLLRNRILKDWRIEVNPPNLL